MGRATEALNDSLRRAEKALLQFSVEGSVQLRIEEEGAQHLRFAKAGSVWRLEVAYVTDEGEVDQAVPATSAPRELRFLAAERFPELITQLRATQQGMLDRARRARDIIEEAIAPLGPLEEESDEDFSDDIPF